MDDKKAAKAAKREARENAIAERAAKLEARKTALKEKTAVQNEAHKAKMAEIKAKSKAADEELKQNLSQAKNNMSQAIGEFTGNVKEMHYETKEEFEAAKAKSEEEWRIIKADFESAAASFKEAGELLGVASKDMLLKAPLGEEKRKEIRESAAGDKKLEKSLLKDAKNTEKARVESERLEKFGNRIADDFFWSRRICIYEKGYISVRMLMGGPNFDKPEKLLSISGSSQVFDKSFWTDSLQGDLYLTIVTEAQTYSIKHPMPDTGDVRRMKGLVATGQSVISRTVGQRERPTSNPQTPPSDDVTTKLESLVSLKVQGLLSDEEFTNAKAKLLGL